MNDDPNEADNSSLTLEQSDTFWKLKANRLLENNSYSNCTKITVTVSIL